MIKIRWCVSVAVFPIWKRLALFGLQSLQKEKEDKSNESRACSSEEKACL